MSITVSYKDCQPYNPPSDKAFLEANGWTKEEFDSLPDGLSYSEADAYIKAHRKSKQE